MRVRSICTQCSKSHAESSFLPFPSTASFTEWRMEGTERKVSTHHPLQAQLTEGRGGLAGEL